MTSAARGLALAGLFLPASLAAQGPARPVFVDGQAQVVPAFADSTQWIRERLWVETSFDSDGDGRLDRVHVDVVRPRQTATEGLKVPVIYETSPYFAGTSGPRQFLWDVRQELGAESPTRTTQPAIPFQPNRTVISTSQVRTWVPRGFAVVHSESPGTGLSQGCPTIGGDNEALAPKAVVDWLNGRAKGYTAPVGGTEVSATAWSTGKVGMTGTSFNGTLPLAAATTGVAGLEAIIPIAPNTSYYHYYRSNGLVRHPGGWLGEDIDFLYDFVHSGPMERRAWCNANVRDGEMAAGRDRRTGDYNPFWRGRDYLPKVGGVKAAVLMAHAFNDWNVVPEHSLRISTALKARGIPVQQFYHQGGHGGEPPLALMNRWFSRYLYGIENGVERDAKAWIVREGKPRTEPTPYADFPNPAARRVVWHLSGDGRGIGTLGPARGRGTQQLVDNVDLAGGELAALATSPNRLLFATPQLTAPLHLSGTAQLTIRMAANVRAVNLSAWLVTLPWEGRPTSLASVVTRGWADPQNHRSLKAGGNYDAMQPGEPLVPGRFVEFTFDLQPDDQIIPAGKRLALMIFSSDRDFTLWPTPGSVLAVDLARTSLALPIVNEK